MMFYVILTVAAAAAAAPCERALNEMTFYDITFYDITFGGITFFHIILNVQTLKWHFKAWLQLICTKHGHKIFQGIVTKYGIHC